MGKKLRFAPVYYTIVQAKFNPILALESYLSAIHEPLRRRFPDVQRTTLTTVNLTPAAPPDSVAPQVPVVQSTRFAFCNIEKTACLVLDQGGLTFQTTEYEGFQKFSEDFVLGLRAIDKAVQIIFTDRIGLRYLDAILPKSDDAVNDYLTSSLLGLSETLGGFLNHSFSETFIRKAEVNIVARAIIQNGRVGLPPDLSQTMLPIAERFQSYEGRHAILDIDSSIEVRKPFDLTSIEKQLFTIHDEIDQAFHASVTEKALREWE